MFRRNIHRPGSPAEDDDTHLCLYDLEKAFDFRTFHTEKLETIYITAGGVLTPKSYVKKSLQPFLYPLRCTIGSILSSVDPILKDYLLH